MSNPAPGNKLPVKIPLFFRLIRRYFPLLEKWTPFVANRIAAFVFFTPLRFKAPDKERETYLSARKLWIKIPGKKVQVFLWGDGKPVLMTHGWSGRATQFRKFIQPFTEVGYKVVAFDGPAHGKSSGIRTHIAEYFETIQRLDERFGPFHASIGHSYGGVANLFAYTRGVRICKMIMISTPSIADEIIKDAVHRLNGSQEREAYLKNYILKKFGVEFNEVSVLNLLKFSGELPLLVIHDLNDKEVPMSHPEAILDQYSPAQLIKTEGLGHLRILKSDAVVNHCLNFIRD